MDETQRLEAAEHLAYCDRCMARYTALLTADVPFHDLDMVVADEVMIRYDKEGD